MDKVKELKETISMGVLPAMATPLDDGGSSVNVPVLETLIDFLVGAGVKGVFVGGTTGEGILLNEGERERLHESAMEAIAGRVPALIHIGANTSTESIRLAKHAREIGADAIVAVTPYFYPVHDEGLLDYYRSISAMVPDIPLFAYDIPQMAINSIAPELVPRLTSQIPSFAGLKSSHPDAQRIRRIVDYASENSIVLAGNERIALGSLALGVDGLISGLSTSVPEPFVALADAFERGDIDRARLLQRKINRILDLIPPGGRIGALKMILNERGIPAGPAVPPRPMPSSEWTGWGKIEAILREP
jgi:dihydrodipicolinate synthase/N-acetylneuraminate lyase